jgi:hypothetical protein
VRNLYSFPDDFSDSNAKDLIKGLLNPKLDQRLGNKATGGFQTIRNHSFFEATDWDTLIGQPSPFARVFNTPNAKEKAQLNEWDAKPN